MDKILEVKKLKISFRTNGGTVKAVRDISFDLERGKTLAIVGESGSGKSVTSKAILGILAGNSIVEGGEILYDGKDLLKINEDEMYKIRGDKVAMIFQDPLSSLNPIVRIGQQLTEAMILKNKANRKEGRKDFNDLLACLKENINAATEGANAARVEEMTKTFDAFCIEANKLENSYNDAENLARELLADMEDFRFLVSKKQKVDVKATLSDYSARLKKITDPFLTAGRGEKIAACSAKLKQVKGQKAAEGQLLAAGIETALDEMKALLGELTNLNRPNFFRIGYYKHANPNADLTSMPHEQLSEIALKALNENFMLEFLGYIEKALEYSEKKSLEKKKALLPVLEEARVFYTGDFQQKEALERCKALTAQVIDSIDKLDTVKDSVPYTFDTGLESTISMYFEAVKNNPREEARFARQTKRRDALIAKGKKVEWKVVPKQVYDLQERKDNIAHVIQRLIDRYTEVTAQDSAKDYAAASVALVDYFKEKASAAVYKVTMSMAKERAIKLMEEVGIPEPRRRYYQYPFEFSGGMRQRIVIAIALSANPDVLICDEPTTALDVTIQAQILKLIKDLQKEFGYTIVFITHDLGVVANVADRVAVLYAGQVVELGTCEEVFFDPRHPYTWALLSSLPQLAQRNTTLYSITGTPPSLYNKIVGDAFAPRNPYCLKVDTLKEPPMFQISQTHFAKTWLEDPRAPKVEKPAIIENIHEKLMDAFNI